MENKFDKKKDKASTESVIKNELLDFARTQKDSAGRKTVICEEKIVKQKGERN